MDEGPVAAAPSGLRGNILSWDIGIRHLAYCLVTAQNRVTRWETIDIGESGPDGPRNKIDSKTSTKLFAQLMSRVESFDRADIVVLERQPPQNNLMRIIQGQLEMFFLCRGKHVEIFDGKSKLVDSKMKNLKGNQKYRERKKEAISQCCSFLEETGQEAWACQLFHSSKKKDDLADCLLQAIQFRERQTAEPEAISKRRGGRVGRTVVIA